MRARLHEPSGTVGLRVPLLLIAIALVIAAFLAPAVAPFAPVLLAAVGGMIALLAMQLRSRVKPVDVEMRLGFGWVEVRRGREGWRRLEGKKMRGARIARASEGASLAIARGLGGPLLVELRDEADAKAMQVALGVPPATGSDVGWAMETSSLEWLGDLVLCLGMAAWIGLALCGLTPNGRWARLPLDLPYLLALVGVASIALSPLLHGLGRMVRPDVTLDLEGLRIGSGRAAPLVPYVLIADVKVVKEGVELQLKSLDDKVANHPRLVPLVGLSAVERSHVATQILSAARDAQGWGKGRRAETLRTLRRAEGEAVAGWLLRLDGLAPKQASVPYRESAIEKRDLAQMIEDPSSPRDVRIAAARVLWRIDPKAARVHVEALGASAQGGDEAKQVQTAVEAELDEAAAAYDAMRPAFRALRG